MPSLAPSPTISLGTMFQYAFLAVLAYALAGAPLLTMLGLNEGDGSGSPSSSSSRGGGRSGGTHRNAAQSPISLDRVESLVIPSKDLACPEHGYRVHVFSREPLVLYIEGFVSEEEREHVVQMSTPLFTPSTVWTSGTERLDPTVRLSEKARLDRTPTVQCIEDRARTFQGWHPNVFVEKLWSQRYGPGGHYTYHYDWSAASRSSGRVSSFMVYLEANCTGGGTHFPRLEQPGEEWCRFVECDGEGGGEKEKAGDGKKERGGVTFKPIAGNAVFWENINADGRGYEESWHAGLPVESGTKIGLNIWSWYQEGWTAERIEKERERQREVKAQERM